MPRPRAATVVAVAILLGCTLLAFLFWSGDGVPAEVTPLAGEEVPAAAADAIREAVPDRVEAPIRSGTGKPDDAAPTENTRRVRGTITVADPSGETSAHESGSAHVVLWFGNGGTGANVDIVDGRWEAEIALGRRDPDAVATRVQFASCRLRDRPVLIEEDSLDLPHDGSLDFFGQWLPESRLRVLDADIGVDLAGVDIVTGMRFPFYDLRHPSGRAGTEVITDARSPFVVPPPDRPQLHGSRQLWVSAPGYTWQRVRHSYRNGGEQVVRLEPAGDLDLWITGGPMPEGAALRLFRGGGPYADVEPRLGKANRIDRLAPGRYRVRLQIGPWFRRPLLLGEAEVEIEPGVRKIVELAIGETATPPAKVAVGGTLVVPAAWRDVERLYITMQPDSEVARWDDDWKTTYYGSFRPTADEGVYRWSLGELFAGNYMLTVSPTEHREMVAVRPDRDLDLRIAVPEPAEVLVRLRDAHSGHPVAAERIAWHGRIPGNVGGYGLDSVRFDASIGGYAFQAPTGEIHVSVQHEGFAKLEQTLDVRAGANEFALALEPVCGVRVVFVEDGREIELAAKGSALELEAIDHDGRVSFRRTGWSHVTAPGRYRLTVGQVAGYGEIPPREVTISAGTMLDVRIQLVRK